MNKLSDKTGAILKENYLSIVYAREMSEGIMNINQEFTTCFLTKKSPDSLKIAKEITAINTSLQEEQNNITEPGEDKLVMTIQLSYTEFRDSVSKILNLPKSNEDMLYLQKKSAGLYQQLLLLSQINGRALEVKTDDAKAFSKRALRQMTILASLCFLIGMSFTFSFASYFNQRFFQLYNGIKEIVSSNFDQRLFFTGNDEFHEISLLLNEMAAKLKMNKQKLSVNLQDDKVKGITSNDIDELKKMLFRIKSMEEQATALITKFEKK
jgi:hypothetical protein